MLTIFILLAGIKSDCFGLAIGIVLFMWAIILGGTGSKHKKLNDIDKYADQYHYNDINWLKHKKL